ncbi:hypothetical protein F4808DRAFT_258078 [Astrocystis sublimbata]|nr:hypothetical protein F4808DRAFT_258078 [Astrocystis sublimbata]
MDSHEDHDTLTRNFLNMTDATTDEATHYLRVSNWDISDAVQSWYADEDKRINHDEPAAASGSGAASSSSAAPPDYTGPRTLDGRPAPQAIPTTSSAASRRPQKKKGLATLSSIGGVSAHDHDDDDDDEPDDDAARRDTYAGGEKSGLAVQDPSQGVDPKRLINDLLSKAKSNARRPEAATPAGPSAPNSFRGNGQTLGGEGAASRIIPDPQAGSPSTLNRARGLSSNAQPQERVLHLWQDGFSIDEGDLCRFDDPRHAEDLRMIQQGRAPVHLMNVRYDEPIDVKLERHNENYRPLPKKYKPFSGEGQRLGSPVPGESAAGAATQPVATTSTPSAAASSSSAAAPSNAVDDSQPVITIRIQLLDGTRLPARFNPSQTVEDIYDFISRVSPELRTGGWVLATTFPNKDHTDKSLVIGEMSEFKKGGTVVVKRSA